MDEFNVIQDCQDPSCTIDTIVNNVRRFQIHEVNKNRKIFSEYYHLFPILRKYGEKFKKYARMSVDTFDYVLAKIHSSLEKNWCNFHTQPIVAEERLVITLRFLATGSTYSQLSFSFRMGESTVCNLIREVLEVLWNELCPIHMAIPTTENFYNIAQDFELLWDLPHCIGAIDGYHVQIKKPSNSGSLYYNYKGFYSIVLQAVVDARYRFIAIDVGGYGHQHDATTFINSSFYAALENKQIRIPEPDELPISRVVLPYFIVGDGAYPLSNNLLKPYPGKNLPTNKKVFNRRLSRGRVVVECAFGQMSQRWRIFHTVIEQEPAKVELIVKAVCVLNNVIIDLQADTDTSEENSETESATACEQNDCEFECIIGNGKDVRDVLTKYFMQNPI